MFPISSNPSRVAAPAAANAPARPDILGPYLADPDNRERFKLLTTGSSEIEHRDLTRDPAYLPGTHEIFHATGPNPMVHNRFLNAFSPDTWILLNNIRSVKDTGYHASDVILAQYHLVSLKLGFQHSRPEHIVLHRVSNQASLDFLKQNPDDLAGFLNSTALGKCARHLLAALHMECSDWHWDSGSRHLTLAVKPVGGAIVQVSPWQDPAPAACPASLAPPQTSDLATLENEWMLLNLQSTDITWSDNGLD